MIPKLRPVLMYIGDTSLAFYFLYRISTNIPKMSAVRKVGCTAALIGLFYLYITPYLFNFWIRFGFRVAAYFLLFLAMNRQPFRNALFFSVFLTLIFTACQNIFSAPFFYEFMRNRLPVPSAAMSTIWDCSTQFLLTGLVLLLIYNTVPLKRIENPNLAEWFVLCLTAICEIYVKDTLYYFQNKANQDIALTTFTLMLQIFQLCFLAFFESFITNQRLQREQHIQNITNQYRLQSLEQNQQCDETVRALNHDIKNHLRAIRQLAAAENNTQLNAYINSLLRDAESDSRLVETGNSLLNGLLADKARQAAQSHIEMDILLDFSNIHFLEDWSLCTIFGNLIDNAIEACQHISDLERRRICIRGGIAANFLQIVFRNTCVGMVALQNGLPLTTKEHPQEHGIGLRNVHSTIKKFDGVLAFDTSESGWFQCTVQIPLPNPEGKGECRT